MWGGLVLQLFFINDDIWLVLTIFYSYEKFLTKHLHVIVIEDLNESILFIDFISSFK